MKLIVDLEASTDEIDGLRNWAIGVLKLQAVDRHIDDFHSLPVDERQTNTFEIHVDGQRRRDFLLDRLETLLTPSRNGHIELGDRPSAAASGLVQANLRVIVGNL